MGGYSGVTEAISHGQILSLYGRFGCGSRSDPVQRLSTIQHPRIKAGKHRIRVFASASLGGGRELANVHPFWTEFGLIEFG